MTKSHHLHKIIGRAWRQLPISMIKEIIMRLKIILRVCAACLCIASMPFAYAGGSFSSAASVVDASDLGSLSGGGIAMQLSDLMRSGSITSKQAVSAYRYLTTESNVARGSNATPDQLTEALEKAGVKVNKATEAEDAADATKADDTADASKVVSTSESKGLQDGPALESSLDKDDAITSQSKGDEDIFEESDDESDSSDGLSSVSDISSDVPPGDASPSGMIADSMEEASTSADEAAADGASAAGSAATVVEELADGL